MNTQQLKKRIHNVQGQMEGIIKMIESGKACTDVLIQFKAARSGLERVFSIYLEENLMMCVDLKNVPEKKKKEIEKIIAELTKF